MLGRLDDHFVRADTVHLVEHALGLTVQVALNAQRGEFVGHNPDGPTWGIALGRTPAIGARAIGLNLGRSLVLVAVTERAKTAADLDSSANKVGRALGPVG